MRLPGNHQGSHWSCANWSSTNPDSVRKPHHYQAQEVCKVMAELETITMKSWGPWDHGKESKKLAWIIWDQGTNERCGRGNEQKGPWFQQSLAMAGRLMSSWIVPWWTWRCSVPCEDSHAWHQNPAQRHPWCWIGPLGLCLGGLTIW